MLRRRKRQQVYYGRFVRPDHPREDERHPVAALAWLAFAVVPYVGLVVGLLIQPAHHVVGGTIAIVSLIVVLFRLFPFSLLS